MPPGVFGGIKGTIIASFPEWVEIRLTLGHKLKMTKVELEKIKMVQREKEREQ
jgi:hypothetical protein